MMPFELLLVLTLIGLNGFFAMSEMAVMVARRNRLQQLAQGSKRARWALELAEQPERFLSSVQVWITLIGILIGYFGGETLAAAITPLMASVGLDAPWAGRLATVLALGAILFFSVVLGELVPKRIAIIAPERLAIAVAPPMRFLALAAKPLVTLLAKTTELLLRLFGIRTGNAQQVTEEEIKLVVAEGAAAGVIDADEHAMVNRVLSFGDRTVESLMQPRTEIVWLDASAALAENLAVMRATPYSRYPVKRASEQDVIGILQVKSLAEAIASGRATDLFAHLSPAIFVPEAARAIQLLQRFRDAEAPLALVVDEFGDIVGMVTPNNLLNAVFGRLVHSIEDGEEPIVKRAEGSWLVDGRVSVDDLRETIGVAQLPHEDQDDFRTAAGMMIAHFGRIPKVGEHFEAGGMRYEVVDLDGARIDKLLIDRLTDGGGKDR